MFRLEPIVSGIAVPALPLARQIVEEALATARPQPFGAYLAFEGEQCVGTCAFKNGPASGRPPEIAYFTFPSFERRGHATAMARAMVEIARAQRVPQLVAETLPTPNPSTKLLERLGFHRAGEGVDHEIGVCWRWALTLRVQVMGVVNVTPDSLSDGGLFLGPEQAIAHGKALAAAGADLLDIGGESTRPGAADVSEADELARVLPVLRGLKGVAELSIDTTKPAVAAAALEAGASLVNDVTGLRDSDELARLAAKAGAKLCVMHMKGVPRTMQQSPTYDDVVAEVLASLRASVDRAVAAGMPRERVIIDPGIGFGKTFEHNWSLLKHLGRFRELGQSVLLGTSRKAFLGAITGGKPAPQRDVATAATVAIAVSMGAVDFVRVHSVSEARDAILVGQAVRCAR